MEDRTAVFVCPYCGLVSEYSRRDTLEQMMVDKPSLFQSGECILVSIEVECDGKNCEAPKTVHVVRDGGKGTWKFAVVPKDWKFSDTAKCGAGHQLRFDKSRPIPRGYRTEFPL